MGGWVARGSIQLFPVTKYSPHIKGKNPVLIYPIPNTLNPLPSVFISAQVRIYTQLKFKRGQIHTNTRPPSFKDHSRVFAGLKLEVGAQTNAKETVWR